MKKSMLNRVHLEGLLYQHNLERRTTGPQSKNPGTEYIAGTVEVLVDDDGLNSIPVHYSFVSALTNKGTPNANYNTLAKMIDGEIKSVMAHGKENADKIRIDSAIALNEFYSDRSGTEELVSTKRNEGGFVHVMGAEPLNPEESVRNHFEVDMIITNTYRKEANEERQVPEKLIVKGAIFDFKNSLLPVEFSVIDPSGMNYFESLGASNREPVFTKVWGSEMSQTVVSRQESAFGEALVRTYTSSGKDFVISGTIPNPYPWDDESTITAQELAKAMQDRELYLATVKKRQDEYKAQKATQNKTTTATATVNPGSFQF